MAVSPSLPEALRECYERLLALRLEREKARSTMQWVEISHEMDEENGRIARLRWEISKASARPEGSATRSG
jgi:hypothetical protein